jgi:hypothetical protein
MDKAFHMKVVHEALELLCPMVSVSRKQGRVSDWDAKLDIFHHDSIPPTGKSFKSKNPWHMA